MRNLPFTTSDPARQVTLSARELHSPHGSNSSSPPFGGHAERAGKSRLGTVPPSRSASPVISSDSSRREARRDRKPASSAYACGLWLSGCTGQLELAACRTQAELSRPTRSCGPPLLAQPPLALLWSGLQITIARRDSICGPGEPPKPFCAGREEPAPGQSATSTACFTAALSRPDANHQRGKRTRKGSQ